MQDFAKRCENVIIENQDFETLIKHYDRPMTFTYCDPPYFTSEYVYDCGFTWEDHLRLYHALAGMKGKFLLSYNDCPEIRELYKEYNFFDFKRVHSMAQKYEAGKEFPGRLVLAVVAVDGADIADRDHHFDILPGVDLVANLFLVGQVGAGQMRIAQDHDAVIGFSCGVAMCGSAGAKGGEQQDGEGQEPRGSFERNALHRITS